MEKHRTLTVDLSVTTKVDPELRRQREYIGLMRTRLKYVTKQLAKARAKLAAAECEDDNQVDVELATLRIDNQLETHEEARQTLHDAREANKLYRELPEEQRPQVEVAMLPPAKMTEMKVRASALLQKPDPVVKGLEAAEIDRQLVRWGVVGWEMCDGRAFSTEEAKHRGKKVAVASWAVIDQLEAMGWLGPLALDIWDHNYLDEELRGK